jgi:acylphosphatase
MKVRSHVFLTGAVQGVFFRSTVRAQAAMRGVNGWVRNLRDGRVEIVMEGNKQGVDKLIDFCRTGPPGSRVDHTEVSWETPTHKYQGFEIRV